MTSTLLIPIRTGTGLNEREHWAAKHRRVKSERAAVHMLWPAGWRARFPDPLLPLTVHLVRVSPGTTPIDDDNLAGALKAVRDEVASELRMDDGDTEAIRFTYAQERGPWGVRIAIQEREKCWVAP